MIEQALNSMLKLLLVKFMTNDMPHAFGMYGEEFGPLEYIYVKHYKLSELGSKMLDAMFPVYISYEMGFYASDASDRDRFYKSISEIETEQGIKIRSDPMLAKAIELGLVVCRGEELSVTPFGSDVMEILYKLRGTREWDAPMSGITLYDIWSLWKNEGFEPFSLRELYGLLDIMTHKDLVECKEIKELKMRKTNK